MKSSLRALWGPLSAFVATRPTTSYILWLCSVAALVALVVAFLTALSYFTALAVVAGSSFVLVCAISGGSHVIDSIEPYRDPVEREFE